MPSLDDLLDRRCTTRDLDARPVEDDALVRVLWAAQGRTSDGRRTTPSAGGRHPLRLLVARGPHPAGTWWWDPLDRTLQRHGDVDVRGQLAEAAIGDQPWVADAPVTVAICADVRAMVDAYHDQPPGDRGQRYVDIEVGAAVQNLALRATALGLTGVIVGGFDDARVSRALALRTVDPRLLFSLGHPR